MIYFDVNNGCLESMGSELVYYWYGNGRVSKKEERFLNNDSINLKINFERVINFLAIQFLIPAIIIKSLKYS